MFDDSLPIILGLILIATAVLVNTFKTNRSKIILLTYSVLAIVLYRYNVDFQLPVILVTSLVFIGIAAMKLLEKRRQLAIIMVSGLIFSIGYTWSVNTVFYSLKPHQQDRILVWLRPDKVDPLGALYNVTWSKRAIGSGGFAGKGFLPGNVTKLNYVPEQVTDFIFCTVGEEQGFIGAFAVIMLFLLLLLRILFIAERQRSKFTRIYAYGVASILFFHLLVNVGMTMGIVPVIGIPLPFFYLIFFYALAAFIMNFTRLGREIYAVGGNPAAAVLTGINVRKVQTTTFVIAGLMTAIGAILMSARLNSGSPNYGQTLELQAIAAAVVGGASLAGGRGNILATLMGAMTIVIVQNGLNLNAAPSSIQNVVLGLIILMAVGIDMWRAELSTLIFSFVKRFSSNKKATLKRNS